MSGSDPQLPYFHIRQGRGGVVKLPQQSTVADGHNSASPVHSIGTTDCNTCVGVYIPLTDDSSFVAHIAVQTGKIESDESWIATEEQGADLKEFMKRKIYEAVGPRVELDERYKQDAVLVCLNIGDYTNPAALRITGRHVIQAFLEYFGLERSVIKLDTDGFVVNHSTRISKIRTWDERLGGFDTPTEMGFVTANEDPNGLGIWGYILEEDRWMPASANGLQQ